MASRKRTIHELLTNSNGGTEENASSHQQPGAPAGTEIPPTIQPTHVPTLVAYPGTHMARARCGAGVGVGVGVGSSSGDGSSSDDDIIVRDGFIIIVRSAIIDVSGNGGAYADRRYQR